MRCHRVHADPLIMAIDVQLTVPLPLYDEDSNRIVLRKIVSLPVTPRVTDEVFFPLDAYVPVSRVRFRADGHVELFFEDNWSLQYGLGAQTMQDVADALSDGGFTAYTLWDAEPEPDPVPEPEPEPSQP